MNNDLISGIFSVWKPKGLSSNAALNILRRSLGTKHIGHAGTLDPLAEGILVVAVGRESTKRLSLEVEKEKEYQAEITLGAVSATDDGEGPIQNLEVSLHPVQSEIEKAIQGFIGTIEQVPPAFSALKIKGERAYRLARSGQMPEMKARPVQIKNIQILSYIWPVLNIRVTTGPGVYIRSLARDLGKILGVGGYLSGLVRTRVGQWDEKSVEKIDWCQKESSR